jgi:hypothetical protein
MCSAEERAYGDPGTVIPGQLAIDAHRRQYENFLAALAGREALRVDLETYRHQSRSSPASTSPLAPPDR